MPPFVDDPVTYPNATRIIRILRNETFWFPKDTPTRASSGAFFDGTKQNSFFVLDQLTPEHFDTIRQRYPDSKLALITAGDARAQNFRVCEDPDEFLAGHLVVCPPPDVSINEYRRMAGRLAELSVIYEPGR